MSNNISLETLLDNAGSDYEDLPSDVKTLVDDVEADLTRVGVDVDADLATGADADVAPSVVVPPSTSSAPESFSSRTSARAFVKDNPGYRVVDNGASAANRWTVGSKSDAPKGFSPPSKKETASTTVVNASPAKSGGKKAVALVVYRELEASGNLKRSNFLSEMSSRTGLSAKGASSYFYNIKGGKW